jgi:hypothetical protein
MPDNFSAADVQAIQVMERGGPPPTTPPAGNEQPNVGTPAPQVQAPTVPPTAPATPTTPPAQGTQPGGTAPQTPGEGQDEYEYTSLEDLGFQDMTELQERLERAAILEQELEQLQEYKNGPKFASDRQKYLYDFANKFEGMELSAAQQLLNVVSLDLKSLPDQHARFEAFRLDPINKGLSQEDLMALFTDEERLKFGNSQDPAEPQTPAQKAREKQAYQEEVFERLSKFGGIQVNLSAQGDNGENAESAMQFALNDENQIQEIVEAVADPLGWWDNMLYDTGVLQEGKQGFDAVKFAQLVTVITHREQLLNNAYQQGREDYKASLLKTSRNVSVPGNGLGGVPIPPGTMTEKQESVKEAMKVAGMI